MAKKQRNKINGVMLLDKPLGLSSNQAIQKVRYILNAEKVGHTGTLDPLATGLLPICLGEATKFASYLLDGDKEYIATAQLGVITDSGDSEGNIVATKTVNTSLEQIKTALNKFTGAISQVPPMYSALKYHGRPLYEYAREGIVIDRPERHILIHELELVNYDPESQQLTFRALVSKGTYIRTLAEDIGNYLGSGASLIALRRTKTNQFNLAEAFTVDELQEFGAIDGLNRILPCDVLVTHLPSYPLSQDEFEVIKYGNLLPVKANSFPLDAEFRLYANEHFLGIASYILKNEQIFLKPSRLLSGLANLSPWH